MNYPWYQIINDRSVEQGDVLKQFPILKPQYSSHERKLKGIIHNHDMIILTQSCELTNDKIEFILLGAIHSFPEIEAKGEPYKSSKWKERLRRGYEPGYHLLNDFQEQGFNSEFQIVDFRNIYTVPKQYLIDFIPDGDSRLRLLPPYREHLSQAFARYFMRVGLPVDIPAFNKSI